MERPRMAISAPRAFALGACSILVIAGVFVAGIGIGARGTGDAAGPESDAARAAIRTDCPALGFRATRADTERADSCEMARAVQETLLEAGALGANVQVRRTRSNEQFGPEYLLYVTAQVYLPDPMHGSWDAEQAARVISGQVGTTTQLVTILDENLATLFDGRDVTSRAAPPATSRGPSSP